MTELALVVALAATGWVVLDTDEVPAPLRVAASLPLGVATFVTAQLVLLAAVPTAAPLAALAAAVLVALAVGLRRRRAPSRSERGLLAAAAGVVLVVTVVVIAVPVVNVTVDSFLYLALARLLARGELIEIASSSLLQDRGLVTAAVHGLAPVEPGYLRPLGPLVGLATAASVWVLTRRELAGAGRPLARWAAAATVALLVTNHRFVFSALYVNSHALVAVWLLLLVALCWWVVRDPGLATPATAVVVVLLVVALVVARPEGVLLATLAVVPVVVNRGVARWWRACALASVGVASSIWHAVLLGVRVSGGEAFGDPQLAGLVALGAVLVVVAPALGLVDRLVPRLPRGSSGILVALHALLWLAVAALATSAPGLVGRSVGVTLRNLTVDGLWGVSGWVLVVLLVACSLLVTVPAASALWFPLVSFLPFGLLLALLRGSPYRLGPGDSFNRMLVHVVPLAVTIIGVSVGADLRSRWRSRLGAGVGAGPPVEAGPLDARR